MNSHADVHRYFCRIINFYELYSLIKLWASGDISSADAHCICRRQLDALKSLMYILFFVLGNIFEKQIVKM